MKSKYLLLSILIALQLPLFAQQADLSLIPFRKGDLWGYAGPDKKLVITPAYDEANLFYAGLASVRKGSKYGYINMTGKLVIPLKFAIAKNFKYGYTDNVKNKRTDTVLFAGAAMTADGMEKCIDSRGNQMLKCPAISESTETDISNLIIRDSAISIYSTLKKSETFDKVVDGFKLPGSEDDYYIAIKGDEYGVINNKYDRIAPFEYNSINKLIIDNTVYLLVAEHGLNGVLNGNGSVLMPVEFTRIVPVKATNGKEYLIVSKNGNTGIKDMQLQQLVAEKFSDILYDKSGGFLVTGNKGLMGYYFLNNYLLEPVYSELKPVTGGNYVWVRSQTGRSGFISDKGVEFFEE